MTKGHWLINDLLNEDGESIKEEYRENYNKMMGKNKNRRLKIPL